MLIWTVAYKSHTRVSCHPSRKPIDWCNTYTDFSSLTYWGSSHAKRERNSSWWADKLYLTRGLGQLYLSQMLKHIKDKLVCNYQPNDEVLLCEWKYLSNKRSLFIAGFFHWSFHFAPTNGFSGFLSLDGKSLSLG